jgi:lysozyme
MRIMARVGAASAFFAIAVLAGCGHSGSGGDFAGVQGAGARGDASRNVPPPLRPAPAPKVATAPADAPSQAAPASPRPTPAAPAPAPSVDASPAPAAPAAAPGERVAPPFDGLTTSQQVIDILKEAEGLRLESYQDGAGNWFVGYGHGGTAGPGMTITVEEAEALLRDDLATFEKAVRDEVIVPLNQGEFSALTYLAYTIGTGNFAGSSVVRLLNQNDRAGAADAFLLWTKGRRNGELVELPGLVKLREKQRALFLGNPI